MNTMTPIAYSAVSSEFSTLIIALYPYRVDWLGYSQTAYCTYHLLAFDVEKGADEDNIEMPDEMGQVITRDAAERLFLDLTGTEIPEEAFEGRVS